MLHYEILGFFNDRHDAIVVLNQLEGVKIPKQQIRLIDGEEALRVYQSRRVRNSISTAAIGAITGLVVALLGVFLMSFFTIAAGGKREMSTVLFYMLFSGLLCAGIGAYYGMFMHGLPENAVLMGLQVPKDRIEQVRTILRAGGARFLRMKKTRA